MSEETTSVTDTVSGAGAALNLSPPTPASPKEPDPRIGTLGTREHWKPRPIYPLNLTLDKLFNWKDAPEFLGPNVLLKLRTDDGGNLYTHIQLANLGVIRDTGNTLEVRHTRNRPVDWKTLETTVLLGAARFGTVNAFGSDDFILRAWAIAERNGLHITVPPELEHLHKSYKELHSVRLQAEVTKVLGPVDENLLRQRALERASADRISDEEAKKMEDAQRLEQINIVAEKLKSAIGEQRALQADVQAVNQSKSELDQLVAAKTKDIPRREPRPTAPGGGGVP